MKAAAREEIDALLYRAIADAEGDPKASIYLIGAYLVTVPETGRITYQKATENTQLLEAAKEALEYLTDHGIDLEGEDEEFVAGIRLRLDEAIIAAES